MSEHQFTYDILTLFTDTRSHNFMEIKASKIPSAPHLVLLPYLSYAGVCAEDAEVASALIQEARGWMQRLGAKNLELHNRYQVDEKHIPKETDPQLFTSTDKVTMILPLPRDAEALWKSFKAKVWNQVRKAQKSGLHVEVGEMEFLFEIFVPLCLFAPLC